MSQAVHTATLNLTINNSSPSSDDVTACNSFDWNGVTYTESGTYTFTTTNAVGCDSTANLNLSIIDVQDVTSVEINNITATSASLDWDNVSPTNMYNIRYSYDGGLS